MSDVQHVDVAPGHHDSGSFGHDEVHQGLSDKQYIYVALLLSAVTAFEVTLTYMDLPHALFMVLLLVAMAFKFFTVVLFFMHIRFDNPIFGRLFYTGLGLAVFVYTFALFTFHFFSG